MIKLSAQFIEQDTLIHNGVSYIHVSSNALSHKPVFMRKHRAWQKAEQDLGSLVAYLEFLALVDIVAKQGLVDTRCIMQAPELDRHVYVPQTRHR